VRQRQADSLFEGEDEPQVGAPVDSQGAELTRQATDAQFSRLPSRGSSEPATGRVIGKITPQNSLLLPRQNDVPDLPFTRASGEIEDTRVRLAAVARIWRFWAASETVWGVC